MTPQDLALHGPRAIPMSLFDGLDYTGSSAIIYVAKHVAESFKKYYGTPRGSTCIIYNGIAVRRIRSHEAWKPFKFYFAGRYYLSKGLPLLIEAFRKVNQSFPGATLHLYGTGPLAAQTKRRIEELGLSNKVFVEGLIPNDQLLAMIAQNSALILPSVYEACPLALLEAYSLGVPVVLFNIAWVQEFAISDVTASLARSFDASDLARAMVSAVKLRRDNEAKIMAFSRQFNLASMIANTLEVYKSLTST